MNGLSISGSTAYLVVRKAPKLNQAATDVDYPITVTNSTTATYTTVGTEFPTGGTYELKLKAVFPGGNTFSSPFQQFAVNY